ncbi:MAG: right-handed parallel beta-helix repeat-containing protein [Verrucomicrobiales bacterium]|nr:right-handed parallel beta-helix repeat-containing protein [Verrucomicrobiales bacterium]
MGYRNGCRVVLEIGSLMRALLLTSAAIAFLAFAAVAPGAGAASSKLFNIRDFGAAGDGQTLDTEAINRAIEVCANAGGGQVRLPPGVYLSGTVILKSRVTLYLDAGARLLGTTNLTEYRQPTPPEYLPEARWGKWHRALLLAENAEDITLAGPGMIDGNRVFDPTGEERMRGPHALVFVGCRRFSIRDLTFVDAANYAIFFQVSDDVEIRGVTFRGGWDGVHWRGAPNRWCHNVTIVGCQFYTGDDSIAGRYWNNTVISDCLINSSCNGIRLIGPATRLVIHDCLFKGPGEEPHRTSGERRRTNMLAAVNLQPGAWDATQGLLDDVLVSDVTIHNTTTPFHFVTKPGNSVGRITVERASVTGSYLTAASIESWAETPMTNVVFRDVSLEFTGGGRPDPQHIRVKGPGVDARPLPAWALYVRGVQHFELDDVRVTAESDDLRPVLIAEDVGRLRLRDFEFPAVSGAPGALTLNGVRQFEWLDGGSRTNLVVVQP